MTININLAKSAGFCFGVRRAIQLSLATADKNKNIFMLGDIVHNEEVVRQIEKTGIKKIKRLGNGKDKILLIRAHGASPHIFKKAQKCGYAIVDATCPMVKEIHTIARRMSQKGYRLIVIGDKNHDEVRGIIGQASPLALVIDDIKNIPFPDIKKIKKCCVVVQSTQDIEKVLKIVNILKRHIKHLKFFNTICRPTRMRQDEIRHMPEKNDCMIIIGSKQSANTRRLYEISKTINPHSYWIASKKEIKKDWFRQARNIGVTAGASTPPQTTKQVIDSVKKILKNR